jgi:hypothetical protein
MLSTADTGASVEKRIEALKKLNLICQVVIMNANLILKKGLLGQSLRTAEVETLMHYAIDLLGFVNKQTQLSIETANVMLASRLKISA